MAAPRPRKPRVPRASAYARAGVDIDRKMGAIAAAKSVFASTFDRNVVGGIGGFGALYRFRPRGMKDPLLCASTDSVGTKVLIAVALDRHDTVGQDIVNHGVNDVLVQGAKPLFALDYVASGRLRPHVLRGVFDGLARACRENGCSLVGGETAEMPDLYAAGEYDLAATLVGVVDREHLLPRRGVRPGDVLLGLRSSGLHTNGYTLARRTLAPSPRALRRHVPDLGTTLGEALLAVHRSYLAPLRPLLRDPGLRALAHITGGGFHDNIPRVLPPGCGAVVDTAAWEVPPLFRMLCAAGKVGRDEAYRVFNMGVGMVVVVAPEAVDRIRRALARAGEDAPVIGAVVAGRGQVTLRGGGRPGASQR